MDDDINTSGAGTQANNQQTNQVAPTNLPVNADVVGNKPDENTDGKIVFEPSPNIHEPSTSEPEPVKEPIAPGGLTEASAPVQNQMEDPRVTDRDKSFKQIFGDSNNNDDFFPKFKKTAPQESEPQGKIEVQQYDIPIKKDTPQTGSNPGSNATTQPTGLRPTNMSPFDQIDTNRAVAMATTSLFIVLILGLSGGFFGYKYFPNLTQGNTATADELKPSKTVSTPPIVVSTTPTPTETPTTSADTTYTNTKYKYSISFPNTWTNLNTSNTQSDTLTLTSAKDVGTEANLTGYKVEIAFQNSNGKLLKDWITDDNTIAGYGTPVLTTLKVDGKDAYQQVISAGSKSMNTYVFQANKVMVISYFAPAKDFDAGKIIYQKIVESIKLN